jgi:acyl dehydratase
VAFTSASCRFLKEVHAGDTLYPQLEIIKLKTQGDMGIVTTRATVHNQRSELVLDGEHTYSLKAASADEKERAQKNLTGIAHTEAPVGS